MPVWGILCTTRDTHAIWVLQATQKLWYHMTPLKDIVWIDKTECVFIRHGWEANTINSCCIPPSAFLYILIPAHPQNIDPVGTIVDHTRTNVGGVNMKNAKYMGINVWVLLMGVDHISRGMISQKHDITVRCWRVDNILCLMDIIHCVVEMH